MGNRIAWSATALLVLAGQSLSAQYVAHFAISGGAHAGTYALLRPTGCALIGGNKVVITDTTAAARNDRIASLVVDPAHFTIRFVASSPVLITAGGFAKNTPVELSGAGTLKLTFQYGKDTFTGEYSGTMVTGSDTARISGTLGCKGAKLE